MNLIFKSGLLFFSLVLFAACQTKEKSPLINLEAQEFSSQLGLKKDSALLIDVRTPDEYKSGHIAGALLIDFTAPGFAEKVAQLPKDKDVFVYCHSGRRSQSSTALFFKARFKSVTNLTSGIMGWQSEKLPIVTE